jgi:hypothetical protein
MAYGDGCGSATSGLCLFGSHNIRCLPVSSPIFAPQCVTDPELNPGRSCDIAVSMVPDRTGSSRDLSVLPALVFSCMVFSVHIFNLPCREPLVLS